VEAEAGTSRHCRRRDPRAGRAPDAGTADPLRAPRSPPHGRHVAHPSHPSRANHRLARRSAANARAGGDLGPRSRCVHGDPETLRDRAIGAASPTRSAARTY
jgi:hypothetical protein